MRGMTLCVRYVDQKEYNALAILNGYFTSNPHVETPLYAIINSRFRVPTGEHFANLFMSQAEQLNFIWVPESLKKA